MSNKLTICSNMLNEADSNLEEWVDNMRCLSNTGVIVVDGGSKDGTVERLKKCGVIVVVDNIIQREGYGSARNQLRSLARKFFPGSNWMCFFDADERIMPEDFHNFKYLRDCLSDKIDVVQFPRIDWYDYEMTKSANDIHLNPDPQSRMTRLNSGCYYVRKCHEQIVNVNEAFFELTNPKINHFHRPAGQGKRDNVGKLCAFLHATDDEWGHTYPKHKKEDFYFKKYKEEGL